MLPPGKSLLHFCNCDYNDRLIMTLRKGNDKHLDYYELVIPSPYQQAKDRDSRLYRMRKLYGWRVNNYNPIDIFKSDYIKAKQKPVIIYQTKEKLMTNDHGGETLNNHKEREVLFPYKRGEN